ncbi:hypothetical protein BDQ17DRAFT_1331004 [Cyathus striatus]|nr:hypothetical protein BDQ17DRAFT_1331004 [Cyathus striatus]
MSSAMLHAILPIILPLYVLMDEHLLKIQDSMTILFRFQVATSVAHDKLLKYKSMADGNQYYLIGINTPSRRGPTDRTIGERGFGYMVCSLRSVDQGESHSQDAEDDLAGAQSSGTGHWHLMGTLMLLVSLVGVTINSTIVGSLDLTPTLRHITG